jgi:hypothetical protein
MTRKATVYIATLLFLAIAAGSFVGCEGQAKSLHDDISLVSKLEGEIVYSIDLATKEALPQGDEISFPVNMERAIVSMPEECDESCGVLLEVVQWEEVGRKKTYPSRSYVYVLDRDTCKNVQDERACDYYEENVVNREGTYCRLLPCNTSKDGNYPIWKNHIAQGLPAEFLGEEVKEGVNVYNFRISTTLEDGIEVCPCKVKDLGAPVGFVISEMDFYFSGAVVDVKGLADLAEQVMGTKSPEDLQTLKAALHEKIPLKHYWVMDERFSVDPRTGIVVDVFKDTEAYYLGVDAEEFRKTFAVLTKYADDPVLGPEVQKWLVMMDQMPSWPPQKIYEYSLEQTDDSAEGAIEYSRSKWESST